MASSTSSGHASSIAFRFFELLALWGAVTLGFAAVDDAFGLALPDMVGE